MKTLTLEEVARLLHKKTSSLRSDRTRNKAGMPPPFKPKGTRKLLFLESEVHSWLMKQKQNFQEEEEFNDLSPLFKSNRALQKKSITNSNRKKGRPLNSSRNKT